MYIKRKLFFLSLISILIGAFSLKAGFSFQQAIAAGVFFMSIAGVLVFWEFRLSFVFFGTAILLMTRVIDLENLIKLASLDVILFLIGMMILVGMLKEAGFFLWIINKLLTVKNLTGQKLFILIMIISAILSGLMDEASSIIIMTKVIIELSDFLEVDIIPLLISSILATNIGSSGTVLGNPIGVLIASKGNLTFEDFLTQALPITVLALVIVIFILIWWQRNYIKTLDKKVALLRENKFFLSLISIPPDRRTKVGMFMFGATIIFIALHRRLEILLALKENTLLFIIPLVSAGIVMIYNREKARQYVDQDVEWTSLLFFMFLFAEAGAIKFCGIADILTQKLLMSVHQNPNFLSPILLYSSGILSSILDNTVVVASYIPIVQSLPDFHINTRPLWWAILFGACYGGNITAIGSTANIIALSIFEKTKKRKIDFLTWLKIGLVVGFVSMTVACLAMLLY